MYQVVLIIQCISILLVLVEGWAVFRNWKGTMHSYLFLACCSTLVSNLGYLFQLRAHSFESYFTALRLSYAGRVWVTFALFLFVTEFARLRVPRVIKTVMALLNVVTYGIVCSTMSTGLYYKIQSFQVREQFPMMIHEDGVWHHVWSAFIILIAFYGVLILFVSFRKERKPSNRRRIMMVSIAMLTMSVSLFMGTLKPFAIMHVYDVTMLGFPVSAVFMLIAIFRYNLLDTAALAREYMIDTLSEAIIAVDETGEICFTNEPALELFPHIGISGESIIDSIRSAIEKGEPIRQGDRIYSPEANILGNPGSGAGTIYTLTDDTDHYRYLAELEEQKRIADNANKAKSRFLANMSHEIRTPINAVLGMDEMIIRESSEKDIRDYAKDIKNAGRTLLSLINDILDFSKIEEGRMEILPTQYELSSVINDIVNMIKSRAQKKGLKFEVTVDPNIPRILYGDEIRIKQVVLNLLTNAVKYTNAGSVKLALSYHKEDEDNISLSFEVTDTGIGMKEEDMNRLYSPFSRIEESRNRTVEGTGLGMSIVRQLLDLMDSHLEVSSVYGEGSRFYFEIRQGIINPEGIGNISDRLSHEKGEEDVYHELFCAPDARVLVVDDTEVNLTVFENLLKQTKMKIDTAVSGAEALELTAENDYDIVFIDHMMPDMDGIETLKSIRDRDGEKETVYIALTANAVSGAREMYINAGFSDYMSKPVDGRRLEEMIKKYLPEENLLAASSAGSESPASDRERPAIMVVDDDEVILETSAQILKDSFDVIGVSDGGEAIRMAESEVPDLILLDINLTGMNGFEILAELKGNAQLRDIPVMFITADEDREKEALGLKNGAIDFIRKPFVPEVLIQRSRRTIALDRYQRDLKAEVGKQTRKSERLTKEMMIALSHTVDAKDHYTNGHSERVAAYAAEIGRRLGKSNEEQKKLYEIGLLHDIGKIGIPEEIINKTEKLTDEEFARIKEHTLIGCEILKGITDMPELSSGARSHHERYDGRGYPDGLARDAIPEIARIICVADCYDAMTSTRTYSTPKPKEVVRAELERCSGTQFDPDIAAVMIAMIDDDKDYIMNERTGGSDVWKGYAGLWVSDVVYTDTANEDEKYAGAEDIKTDKIPAWLLDVSEIDTAGGIANCGSIASLLSVLSVFHSTAPSKADEIENLYEAGNTEDYTIKVHALKSSARVIGAGHLSDMARALEEAGKAGDTDKIERDTAELLEAYRSLNEKLAPLDEQSDDKKPLTPGMRTEAFNTVLEITRSMDYGMMEKVVNDLKGYELSEEDRGVIERITDSLMKLDWESIEHIAEEALDKGER
ncbi:MAG: response regulator [Lachnospiraceae bacterium]|nr:response regulator [Lachnospiraceae bacterium]